MMTIYHNFQFMPAEKGQVPVTASGFQHGYGAFTTLCCSLQGCEYFEAHQARLRKSVAYLGLSFPEEDYQSIILRLLKENGFEKSRIKIMIYAGAGQTTQITVLPMPFSPGPFAPVRLILDSEKRGNLSCYKHKLISYAANARFMRESEQSGIETLFVDYRGFLLETATANLFLIRDNAILTPHHSLPLLDGIIRGELLKIGSFGPFSVKEALIPASDFGSFDGAFLTNAGKKVIWASSLGGRKVDPGKYHDLDKMFRNVLSSRTGKP